jgi:malate dehydrogenase (oxaloacetate-decarboxylating)
LTVLKDNGMPGISILGVNLMFKTVAIETPETKAVELHRCYRGKISIASRIRMDGNLPYVYTPGIAEVASKILNEQKLVFDYTLKGNSVAIVSDCTRVLGLGDIGPIAGLTVMEGKALLFKRLADIDAFPICLNTKDPQTIINTIEAIAPTFGGINLEDISSPKCFKIQEQLHNTLSTPTQQNLLPVPVCHDDQYGTAVTVSAALQNALEIIDVPLSDAKIVFIGCGAAGYACYDLLKAEGMRPKNVHVFHEVSKQYYENYSSEAVVECICKKAPNYNIMHEHEKRVADEAGTENNLTINDAIVDANAIIALSKSKDGIIKKEMIKSMEPEKSIVFALANPTPEIDYNEAKRSGARIVGTALSKTPNQINDILSMPAIFRGILDVGAPAILDPEKRIFLSAVKAIRESVDRPIEENHIISVPGRASVVAKIASEVAVTASEIFKNNVRNPIKKDQQNTYYNSVLKRITPFW